MYQITADIINTFGVSANDKYEESFKVQLVGDTWLKDGQLKKEMITLTVPEKIYLDLKDKVGTTVSLPIAFFAKNNSVLPFFPKGCESWGGQNLEL